jgi:hypothetical protein
MITHIFKRYFQKTHIKLIKLSKSYKSFTDNENELISICRTLIIKPETTLLTSPISEKRYIKNDHYEIFIVIKSNQINIVNHIYSYSIGVENRVYEKISYIFDLGVEKRREQMEKDIMSNIKYSLSNLYNNLKK